MISSEKLFDMLPTTVIIYDKLDLDAYRLKIGEENKKRSKEKKWSTRDFGISIAKYVLKNSQKVKEELFEMVSIMQEITLEEAKAQGPLKMINTLKEVFTDKEATDFFKQAIE